MEDQHHTRTFKTFQRLEISLAPSGSGVSLNYVRITKHVERVNGFPHIRGDHEHVVRDYLRMNIDMLDVRAKKEGRRKKDVKNR